MSNNLFKVPFIKGNLYKECIGEEFVIYNENREVIFQSNYELNEKQFFTQLSNNSDFLHNKYVVCPYCNKNKITFAHIFNKSFIDNILMQNNHSCSIPYLSILSCKCGFYSCVDIDNQEIVNCDKKVNQDIIEHYINDLIEEDF